MSNGANEVLNNLNKFIDDLLPNSLEAGMNKSVLKIEGAAKDKAGKDLGQLVGSINNETQRSGLNIKGTVYTNAEYAPYHHEGTGIYAKSGNGRKTPWTYTDRDGNVVYTVGQKANPFMQDAVDENMDKVLQFFKECVKW